MKETKSLQQTLKDLLPTGSIFHALTHPQSTFEERLQIIKMLNRIESVKLERQVKDMLNEDKVTLYSKYSLYISAISVESHSFVHMTTLGEYNDFATHPFSWWVDTLRPFVKKEPIIDNSNSCNDSWLDKQLKELEHGR